MFEKMVVKKDIGLLLRNKLSNEDNLMFNI